MSQKVFIPLTDEILYEHPELITSPLRPYVADNPCFHWMATIDMTSEGGTRIEDQLHFDHTMILEDVALDVSERCGAGRQSGSALRYYSGSSLA